MPLGARFSKKINVGFQKGVFWANWLALGFSKNLVEKRFLEAEWQRSNWENVEIVEESFVFAAKLMNIPAGFSAFWIAISEAF